MSLKNASANGYFRPPDEGGDADYPVDIPMPFRFYYSYSFGTPQIIIMGFCADLFLY
jgi:hypothetical protein